MNDSTRVSLRSPVLPPTAPRPLESGTALSGRQPYATVNDSSTTNTLPVVRENARVVAGVGTALDLLRASRAASLCRLTYSIVRAGWWLNWFADFLTLHGLPLRAPHVTVGAEDEVVFEWWHRQRKLTLYITPEAVEFVKVWGADIFEEMDDGPLTSGSQAVSLWVWLTTTEQ